MGGGGGGGQVEVFLKHFEDCSGGLLIFTGVGVVWDSPLGGGGASQGIFWGFTEYFWEGWFRFCRVFGEGGRHLGAL